MPINIEITGDRTIGLKFDEFPDQIYEDLHREINALANEAFAREAALLPVRSGRMASQERVRVFPDKNRITGYVDFDGQGSGSGSDYANIGALEYGSKGTSVSVAEHTSQLDHVWNRHLAAPLAVLIKAFDRTPNIGEHDFARGTITSMQGEVTSRLNAVVAKAADEFNK